MKRIDKFEILDELGAGGMSRVYKGHDKDLDRFVAIKELRSELQSSSETSERFTREARALARLDHPNIIKVYSFLKKQNANYFIMEYVDGITLDKLIEKAKVLPVLHGCLIANKVAEALAYAHSEGFIHRDVKPSNIIISKSGEVKLMDFGISRSLVAPDTLTSPGIFIGTPAYSSPEQMEGRDIDLKTDIFSLGIVIYEMLTGSLPFKMDAERNSRKRWHFVKAHRKNREIPWLLSRMISNCLRYSLSRRSGNTAALSDTLKKYIQKGNKKYDQKTLLVRFLEGENITATDKTVVVKESGMSKRPLIKFGFIFRFALIVLGASLITILFHNLSTNRFIKGPDGILEISVSPWGDVAIGETFRERVADEAVSISLPAGSHSVKIHNPFCKPEIFDIKIEKNSAKKIKILLKGCH